MSNTPSNTLTTTKDFLEHCVEGLKQNGVQHSGINGYFCLMDFVLQHGRYWMPGSTFWSKGGGMCYVHAGKAAMRNRDYTFVEGYAVGSFIPVQHAWIVDKHGLVIETTWDHMGSGYFGVPFRTDYLRQQVKATGRYSMIDQYENDWTTIRTAKELWLRKI